MSNKIIYTIYDTVCIDIIRDDENNTVWGLYRNRTPDAGWGDYSKRRLDISEKFIIQTKMVNLTQPQIRVLIEDLAHYYGTNSNKFYDKLTEFDLRFRLLTELEIAIEKVSKIKVTGKYQVVNPPKIRREKGYYWIKKKNNINANWLIGYWNGIVFSNESNTYLNDDMLIDDEKITRTHKIQ